MEEHETDGLVELEESPRDQADPAEVAFFGYRKVAAPEKERLVTDRLFPEPDELSATLERIGFGSVNYRRLTSGIAVVHLGFKARGSGRAKRS